MFILYLGFLLIPLAIYHYEKHKKISRFFKEKGLKYYRKPTFFFGNSLPIFLQRKHPADIQVEFCREHPEEPLLGIYDFQTPTLIVQNADYAEKILIKDFTHFTDHGFDDFVKKTKNPFDESLFTMNGKRWRAFRYKMSPIFTTGKLKSMFLSMVPYTDSFKEFLKKRDLKGYNIHEAAKLYSMDLSGSSIFGIQTNILKNPNCEYYRIGKMVFDNELLSMIRFLLITILPGFIIRWLGWSLMKPKVIDYFSKVVRDTLNYRIENGVERNDMMQLLLQLREKNKIEITSWDPNDDYLKTDEKATDSFEVTDEIITVHAVSFLIGGFDSLGLTMLYTCFELTQHPDIQERVRSEIREQMETHSGLTFEAVKRMTYLENVVKETLRIHPAITVLMRCCTKDYTFPNGYTIRKGEKLNIQPLVIHHNPNYFSEPELFRPERFEEPIRPGTYLPFGDGPRVCIAMRYALLHVKMGIASILMNYRIKLSSKTKLPIKYKGPLFFLVPENEILFDLEEIN